MKKVLTIQDISCVGKCSATIALPIISAMGIETAILPTTVLSTHTKFSHVHIHDMTSELEPIIQRWEQENIRFDIIYIGYLGTEKQIEIVETFLKKQKEQATYVILDPVMGDHGKLYRGFGTSYVQAMKSLCQYADLLLPNMTEAALLTDMPIQDIYMEEIQQEFIDALMELKISNILLTGMQQTEEEIFVGHFQRNKKQIIKYGTKRVPAQYHGTGDLFASVCTGAIARGMSISESVKLAMDYVGITMEETRREQTDERFGVLFEKTIPYLVQKIYQI